MHYIFQPYNYNLSDPESIPNLFLKHLSLVGIIMLISLVIAIPVGILVVPVELSATVAVHVDAWFTNTVKVHDNAGLVLLLLTVTVPAPELAT